MADAVNFVLTFEETRDIFDAFGIEPSQLRRTAGRIPRVRPSVRRTAVSARLSKALSGSLTRFAQLRSGRPGRRGEKLQGAVVKAGGRRGDGDFF